jgi:MoxR-like ATPase
VIGTQNPLDLAGTYPLPLVQLDRFLLRIPMHYVEAATELEILREAEEIQRLVDNVTPVVSREDVLEAREDAKSVHLADSFLEAIVDIVQATRSNPLLQFGASTRAAIMLERALRAWALVEGRDYATEDDLRFLTPFVLQHRLRFHPGAGDPQDAFAELLRPHMERFIAKSFRATG